MSATSTLARAAREWWSGRGTPVATTTRLVRRGAGRVRRKVPGLWRTTVRPVDRDTVRVSRTPGGPSRVYRLDEATERHRVLPGTVRLDLPDASALVRIAASGLLTGEVRGIEVDLASAPEWLVTGARLPRLGRHAREFTWRRRRGGLEVRLRWSRAYDLHRALTDLTSAVLRSRPWEQTSGPVYALDRTAWATGASSWPHGRLLAGPPDTPPDAQGRPLGPYIVAEKTGRVLARPIVTAVANPYGRRLLGAATRYRLVTGPDRIRLIDEAGATVLDVRPDAGPEAAVSAGTFAKYAVATVDESLGEGLACDTARTLAACGVVFAAANPAVRAELDALGVVVVADADEVADLPGYALSVAASRRMAISADAALRRTALADDNALELPTVSLLVSSMRSEYIETCLTDLAAQTYPALELVLGLHGYDVPEPTRRRWQELLPFPLRIVTRPAEEPFGAVLGHLTRIADGDLVTKVDDDDRYGPHHVTDLVIARHTSGADLVAKGARFVHLPERGETIDRAWAAPEVFDVSPAGGTMLLGRGVLQQVGGWSHSSKHVDEDLLLRIRTAGGLTYRTHALEYVYVRRGAGHTFAIDTDELYRQAMGRYPGLPSELIGPGQRPADR